MPFRSQRMAFCFYTIHGVLRVVVIGWRVAGGHGGTACQETGRSQRTHAVADVIHSELDDAFSSSARL